LVDLGLDANGPGAGDTAYIVSNFRDQELKRQNKQIGRKFISPKASVALLHGFTSTSTRQEE
jgi:hypothetical protein